MKTHRNEVLIQTGARTPIAMWLMWQTQLLWSSGALLVLTGCAKLWSAMGTERILAMQDELLHLSNREIMIGSGLIELVVAGPRTTVLVCETNNPDGSEAGESRALSVKCQSSHFSPIHRIERVSYGFAMVRSGVERLPGIYPATA